MADPH